MNNPRTSAIVSAVAVVLLGYSIFGATEAPSSTLATLQYVLLALALVGLVGSLVKMSR
jgi:hypothetical protein